MKVGGVLRRSEMMVVIRKQEGLGDAGRRAS